MNRGKTLLPTGRYKAPKPKKGKSRNAEYWSARPGNLGGGLPGRDTKKRTHRAERRDGRRQAREVGCE